MTVSQLPLGLDVQPANRPRLAGSYREKLALLLASDLDFHGQASDYASHNFHAFPAKFPPQLPQRFIDALTEPGDVVLDPMAGSGTTVLEAFLAGRHGLALDIDPLALLLCRSKVSPLDANRVARAGHNVLQSARVAVSSQADVLQALFKARFDSKAREFIDYWFSPQTQLELLALLREIDQVEDAATRAFLRMTFSAIIITKSGGVSLARDLAHTRPHRVEDKEPRSPLVQFEKRLQKNLKSLKALHTEHGLADVWRANAQALPLQEASVDLIVTSPPYASNAIDYMRAHKFSLVWLGYPLDTLTQIRKECAGGDTVNGVVLEPLPAKTQALVEAVAALDRKKAQALHRYYSEMTRALREMFRVLKPNRAAIVVVGTSMMRGLDTRTQDCLADLGESLGFEVVGVATRKLDRDRRMMPARRNAMPASMIEQRMHEEYVIGFYKPAP